MKNAIKEYIELTDEEKKELWEKATFVFDTNVLLNLYRYTKNTRDGLFSAMESLKDRIWLPHQVAYEFMKDRTEIIFDTVNGYDVLNKEKDKFLKSCSDKLRINNKDKEYKKLDTYIKKWIKNNKENNLLVVNPADDEILDKLLELYEAKTGEPYNAEELKALYSEGKIRYEKKMPPGYMDAKKQNDNDFGDLIVWKQILAYSKSFNKDIIFVTNDKKEDWWNIVNSKTIGPRPELRKEFSDATNNAFHIYTMESFLNQYNINNGISVDDSIMQEVMDSSKYQDDIASYKNVRLLHDLENDDYIVQYLDNNGYITETKSVKNDIDKKMDSLHNRVKESRKNFNYLNSIRAELSDEEYSERYAILSNEIDDLDTEIKDLGDYIKLFIPAV